jgi:hypothetical protein
VEVRRLRRLGSLSPDLLIDLRSRLGLVSSDGHVRGGGSVKGKRGEVG